jgi:hypothetical protein
MTNNVDLLSPFPQELVRKAPAGKFGDYVPHAHYVERLRDSGVKYSWFCEPIYSTYNGEKRIVGAKGIITIHDGEHMGTYEGFGDIDTFKLSNAKFNDGSNLKDAESDAFKRACMRFGLGVELWSGSKQSEEEATAVNEPEDRVEVTKVDMRKKEHKPTAEDIKRMNDIMDSIVGEGTEIDTEIKPYPKDEAPF